MYYVTFFKLFFVPILLSPVASSIFSRGISSFLHLREMLEDQLLDGSVAGSKVKMCSGGVSFGKMVSFGISFGEVSAQGCLPCSVFTQITGLL